MSTLQRPHRASERALVPITTVQGKLEFPAAVILTRIQRIIETGRGPAYLFVAGDGNAYLLHAEQSTLAVWLRERFGDYVGCYARVRRKGLPTLQPTLDGLCADITEHLATLNAGAVRAGCAP